MAFGPTIDSHWQLAALIVSVSASNSSWLASIVDAGKVYLLTIPIFVLLFSIPAINLSLNLGYISAAGPVRTFAKMAPIAKGVGWALVFLAGEKLYYMQLTGAQNLLYIFFSIRFRLDWALDCNHTSYNSKHCFPLNDNFTNYQATHPSKNYSGHVLLNNPYRTMYPQNHWPAQEFNRYYVRQQTTSENESHWLSETWYFGIPTETPKYHVTTPGLLLTGANLAVWLLVFSLLFRFGDRLGHFVLRYLVLLPLGLLMFVTFALCFVGLDFQSVSTAIVNMTWIDTSNDPYHYEAVSLGAYKTSLAVSSNSMAFTGIIILLASYFRPSSHSFFANYGAILVALMQLIGPAILATLRLGCLGHLRSVQPAYSPWSTTDQVFTFDIFPTCAATAFLGPLWAFIYYVSNFLFATLGPMIILSLFVHNSIIEGFPSLQIQSTRLLAVICSLFSFFGILLCMPLGSTVSVFFGWISQSSIPEIFCLFVVLFIYGWTNINADTSLILNISNEIRSIPVVFFGSTSSFYTLLLFTTVPAFLITKFVSVFDLISIGQNLVKQIDHSTSFLTHSLVFNRIVGFSILYTPTGLILYGMATSLLHHVYHNRLPCRSTLNPTVEWRTHCRLETDRTATKSFRSSSQWLFSSLCFVSHRMALNIVFVVEIVTFIFFLLITGLNLWATMYTFDYYWTHLHRLTLLLLLTSGHFVALYKLRTVLNTWTHSDQLMLYVAMATMETALFNGYFWLFSFSTHGEFIFVPFYAMIINTVFRGVLILTVLAVRFELMSQNESMHDQMVISEELFAPCVEIDDFNI